MIQLNVGFKKSFFGVPIIKEKPLWFDFNLAALEYATEDVMEVELYDMNSQEAKYDLNIAMLYSGYYIASIKGKQKLKYKVLDAAYWLEHLNKTEVQKFGKALDDLIGKAQKAGKQKKK